VHDETEPACCHVALSHKPNMAHATITGLLVQNE